MAAYVVANVDIHGAESYEEYRAGVPATIERYGGRYVARGGTVEVLEGDFTPKRLVIVEFPTLDQARRWYHSPEYAPLRAIRQRTATSQLVLTAGVPQP